MTDVALLFVGAVLLVNGLGLLGKLDSRSGAILNLLVGSLTLTVALHAGFTGDPFTAAKILLFSFTYLWVAYNSFARVEDARAFGWYCLFVAALGFPISGLTLADGDSWFGFFWFTWAALFFLYFLILARGLASLTRLAGVSTIVIAIATCMLPGFLLVSGNWQA
ncbi:MAG: AmiS/UreI family transporter [Acidimicrobiia bacterium]